MSKDTESTTEDEMIRLDIERKGDRIVITEPGGMVLGYALCGGSGPGPEDTVAAHVIKALVHAQEQGMCEGFPLTRTAHIDVAAHSPEVSR